MNLPGIYKITNLVNGKMYIGLSGNVKQRLACHRIILRKNEEHNPHLQNAWNKYGEDKFGFEPILFCEKDELERYEIALIKLYKTQDRKYGYNVTPGGMRICGKDHHMFGKKQTPEWIAMIKKRMTGKNNPFYGTGNKIAMDASKIKCSMPVVQLDKQGNFIKEFSSITEASRAVGVHKSNIARLVKGLEKYRHTAGGYIWQSKQKYNAKILVGG